MYFPWFIALKLLSSILGFIYNIKNRITSQSVYLIQMNKMFTKMKNLIESIIYPL